MAVITVTVPRVEFQKAVTTAYNREKGKYQVQGFRKGHVPQAVIEKLYGQNVFFESTANSYINDAYPEATEESGLTIVSRPEINVTKIDTGEDLVYTATVATKLEIKLGQYKDTEVQKTDATVIDEDLNKTLQKELEKSARLVMVDNRAAKMGDNVETDFDGSINGAHFDGGKGEGRPLVLGSSSFIDGFKEQVVGHKTGDSFDVNMTSPIRYHTKKLADKGTAFACELLEIQREDFPELNGEFASEISQSETFDEYKADLKKQLEEAKAKSATTQNENNVVGKIVENAELALPIPTVEMRCEQMLDDYIRHVQSQGLPLEQYLQYVGMTVGKLKKQFRPQAKRNLKTRLMLGEVVKAKNIAISEEAIGAEIVKMVGAYKTAPEEMEEYVSTEQKEELMMDLKIQEAVDFLVAEAKFQ